MHEHTSTCGHTQIDTSTHMHVNIQADRWTDRSKCRYIYTHINIQMHIHTYTNRHMYLKPIL